MHAQVVFPCNACPVPGEVQFMMEPRSLGRPSQAPKNPQEKGENLNKNKR